MAEAHVEGRLPLSPAEAWALLSDLSRFDEWLSIHDGWEGAVPEPAAGVTATERITVMGIASVVEWTVEDYRPPRSLRISGTGLAGAQIAFTVSVMDTDGTDSVVAIDAAFTGQMMAGAIGEAVEKNVTAELEASLAKLREYRGGTSG